MSKFTFTESFPQCIWSAKSTRSSTQRTSIRIDRFVSELTSNYNKLEEKVKLCRLFPSYSLVFESTWWRFCWWQDYRKPLPHPAYSGHSLTMYLFLSLIFARYRVLSILPFFSSPKRGIQDVHVESNQGTHTLHLVSGAFDSRNLRLCSHLTE